MANLYVEQALSFGIESYEGLWKIQYVHPTDAGKKMVAWIPMDPADTRIGTEIADILVARPGILLVEVMGWLYNRITRYPYYWPKEGTYVDKFGYDFEVSLNGDKTTDVEITKVAYDILKIELGIQPPGAATDREVDIQFDSVGAGGVLVKLSITLERSQPVSELNIAPFTKYPLELVSLMYEEDIETFHPKKELVLNKEQITQTTQSVRIQFPVVTAKRLTLILRQQNPEKNTYNVAKENVGKKELWDSISKREAEVTLDTADGLETISASELDKLSGWDIYMQQLKKYQEELTKWKRDFDEYKRKALEREAALKAKAASDRQYTEALSEYREEYNRAVQKYKTRVATYEKQLKDYNAAYTKYQKDLMVYNKYLRDYADWKNKWG